MTCLSYKSEPPDGPVSLEARDSTQGYSAPDAPRGTNSGADQQNMLAWNDGAPLDLNLEPPNGEDVYVLIGDELSTT